MLLADAGADVVKAEPPGGQPDRSEPGAAMWDRGKRSITVDLATAAGRGRVAELLAGADVLIVNAPASALSALDLDPAAVSAAHPHLVVLHVPPWPGDAPWAGGRESHALLAAASGVARRQASWDGGPIEIVYPHVLYAQGVWAAACAVSALLERDRSGAGQVATVTGASGMLVTSSGAAAFEAGRPPRDPAVGPGGANPCYSRYVCGDGRWLFLGALTTRFQDRALDALGLTELLRDPRVDGVHLRLMAPTNRDWARSRLAEAFAGRSRAEWLEALAAVDCPAGPLEEREGWLDHPQVRAIGMRVELDDPARGRVVMPGNPLVLERTPNRVRGPAPLPGQHDGHAIAWSPRTARGPGAAGSAGPLAGCLVLDLGAIVAGPFAGCLLSDLGADVVKVEPPAGDSFRELGFAYNRGMRSLAIDLRSPGGHRAFLELVRRADVVIDNYRPGVLERLGIDRESLARVDPDVITLSITGYGEGGPLSAEPGFDPILQARSGMMTAQGGDDEPVLHNIPVNDVAAAAFTALGVCLALAHRLRGRGGQRAATSLAGIAAFMQGGELLRCAGRPPAATGGRDHRATGPLDRYYPVRDGWMRVQAGARDLPALRSAGLLASEESDDLEPADAALALALAPLTCAEAAERLRLAGVPATPARRFEELPDDGSLLAAEVVHEVRRDDGTRYYAAGRYARFSRTERRDVLLAPGLGEHSRAVLAEAGLAPAEIEALVSGGVVVEGPPLVVRMLDYR
jgi:crotonobetainyl-CoA:carnitine CoA-transferase CaiB-like acyl-CoA transferase